jgi:uncharacterized protein
MPSAAASLADATRGIRLVDHHCHGVARGPLQRDRFEAFLSEGGPPPAGETNFDSPVGIAVRRYCAPVLDLPVHAPPEDYLARRLELGPEQVNRRFMAGAGVSALCVDTGFRPDELLGAKETADLAPATAHEICRLEYLLEGLAADGLEPAELADRFRSALAAELARPEVVGVKSIAAYRTGFDLDPTRPSSAEVTAAAATWLGAGPGAGGWRVADPVLTRFLLGAAVDAGRPIQLHVGFGDADIRMHRVDPALLTDWLHTHRVPVMLLHCWPHHRTASYLAGVFPHVHLDLGLAMTYVGPARAAALLAEAAEITPFGRLLYSSDAFGLAEYYFLGAEVFRRAAETVYGGMVAAGDWAQADAVRVLELVCAGNAARVYGLEL